MDFYLVKRNSDWNGKNLPLSGAPFYDLCAYDIKKQAYVNQHTHLSARIRAAQNSSRLLDSVGYDADSRRGVVEF
jgi:hypothetical protein